MAELNILNHFTELFDIIKRSLNYYNDNLRNDKFVIEPNENKDKAYKRGETLFDQFDENLSNLNQIINKENEMNKFFEKCKQNKQILIEYKNELINKILQLQKNNPKISKDEWRNMKEDWNKRRDETVDMKNRRECEEILEQIQEEKKELQQLLEKTKNEKNRLSIEEELHGILEDYIKKDEIDFLLTSQIEQLQQLQPNKIKQKIDYNLTTEKINQLEQWTGLKCNEILFDSKIDNWSKETSNFNDLIIGKRQLVFLIEDTTGEKFGYYLNTEIIEKYDYVRVGTDNSSFQFNLESNGRLPGSMRFEIRDIRCGYCLCAKSSDKLINLGDISLCKENKKNKSYCAQSLSFFNYHGIENALCGKISSYKRDDQHFTPKRIIVIQMK